MLDGVEGVWLVCCCSERGNGARHHSSSYKQLRYKASGRQAGMATQPLSQHGITETRPWLSISFYLSTNIMAVQHKISHRQI